MLNIIWPVFILISILYALFSGNIENLNDSIFESAKSSVELTITFFSTICLWTGIMKIAQKTKIIDYLSRILRPIINLLFPEYKDNEDVKQEISMNMIANILGLGNAATPLGLKVMKSMQKNNKNKKIVTNSMAMFIVINTASLQIIPTTVMAIRNSLNSENPTKIIIPVWFATISAFIAVIIVTKLFIMIDKRKGK
ncbi:MAG: nucleoside recognition protein [Clostridia bacterium]|nr:nucleoside recognition protein [Clostridia bacterium]